MDVKTSPTLDEICRLAGVRFASEGNAIVLISTYRRHFGGTLVHARDYVLRLMDERAGTPWKVR